MRRQAHGGNSIHRPKPPVCRSASPATSATAIATLSERRPSAHRNAQPGIGRLVHGLRHAGAFAAEQQYLVVGKGVVEVAALSRGGQQHQLEPRGAPPVLESRKRAVAGEGDPVEIVHAGAAEGAVGHREAGRLDDMRFDPQAGAEPQNRAGVLGDVRLVEGDPHGGKMSGCAVDKSL